VRAIGIAASTGGPQALATLLGVLPSSFAIPIVVVQHMAPGFIAGLASWLSRQAALPVGVATPGRVAGRGIWFAPDGGHLVLDPQLRFGQDTRTRSGRHKPSADVLFTSMAALGSDAVAVVLTGLGQDGAVGVGALVGAGGYVIAQDKASSVVNGMPGSAVDAGAQAVLPLEEIAGALLGLTPAVRR
jgi:two-component system chemotaxis response regulator CheB